MKLDKFLEQKYFSKYRNGIEEIREEFINEGCEKFLWTNYYTNLYIRMKTESLFMSRMTTECKDFIEEFLHQFEQIDFEKEVAFIFPETAEREFFVVNYLSKDAKRLTILKNLFEDDDTINWLVVFDKTKTDVISFIFHLLFCRIIKNSFGGYKLYGYDLAMYSHMLEYNGDILIYKETEQMKKAIGIPEGISFYRFQGNGSRLDTNPYEILAVRKRIQSMIEANYFKDELDIYYSFYKFLFPILQKIYCEAEKVWRSTPYDFKKFKNQKNDLISMLLAQGVINTKWKSEKSLFNMVKKIHTDAIYQYRAEWLQRQSLDIFIPSLSLAIEYQGVQHYKSIDYFGGEESFKRRQFLDQEKKRKCKENYVKLIEWSYNEPLDKKYIINRINNFLETDLDE